LYQRNVWLGEVQVVKDLTITSVEAAYDVVWEANESETKRV